MGDEGDESVESMGFGAATSAQRSNLELRGPGPKPGSKTAPEPMRSQFQGKAPLPP